MKTALEKYLCDLIRARGPLPVAEFMNIALTHPKHGYYMKGDPFGREGDFITAPEISQMFGEIIGAWTADIWMQMGAPDKFTLVECGPGRGTMMIDMLRATRGVSGFHDACRIALVETSPALKEKQKTALSFYNVAWHDNLETIDTHHPVILIANEFLDALPVHQYVQVEGSWQERTLALNENEELEFHPISAGTIMESSPARIEFVERTADILQKTAGAALFIDYGSVGSGFGDTLQAVYKHKPVHVLSHIGDADLTSHVDFESLIKNIDREKIKISGPVTQGAFLKENGIEARAAALMANADSGQKEMIEKSLQRLIDSGQMGTLFKVIGFTSGQNLTPSGFAAA